MRTVRHWREYYVARRAATIRDALNCAYYGGLLVWVGYTFWKYPKGWFLWLPLGLLVVWAGLHSRKKPQPRPVILTLRLHEPPASSHSSFD